MRRLRARRLWAVLFPSALLWALPEAAGAHLEEIKESGNPYLLANILATLFFVATFVSGLVTLIWAIRRGHFTGSDETAKRLLEGDEEEVEALGYMEFKGGRKR